MNIAISNFAWDFNESEDFFSFLNKNHINNLELVLTKYKDWSELNNDNLLIYKKLINDYNLNIYSLQSLFFNIQCDINEKNKMIKHFKKLIDISIILNVKKLVFGSPNLRKIYNNYTKDLTYIFNEIDEYLENKDIHLLVEPNSKIYNGEFFFTIDEIVTYLKTNNFKNIKTMIDTHNSFLEKTNPINEIDKYNDFIEHIHISEMNLEKIKDLDFHNKFSKKLKDIKYDKLLTYEVKKCDDIKNSIITFKEIYS
jgi:sugar phosphate isomerase/epimerase